MKKPEHHIFVCNSFRLTGEPQGTCNKKGAPELLQYIEEEIIDRGIDAMVSSTGCLKMCEKGPVMIIYPNNYWYGNINEEVVDEILDALENGESVKEHLIA
ncbi:MAG: (2Fe-2S) ferredoxin domain-containing protein [Spirochaetes bacterium]|nr:(2Fe-2S) ferredoxin domain-containing protein [Spirochaetota bacterium]